MDSGHILLIIIVVLVSLVLFYPSKAKDKGSLIIKIHLRGKERKSGSDRGSID